MPAPVESKASPAQSAPGTYNIDQGRAVSHAKSPCSVRQNLLNALNQDGPPSCDTTTTKFEFKVPSATTSSRLTCANNKQTVERSNVQNDSSIVVRLPYIT